MKSQVSIVRCNDYETQKVQKAVKLAIDYLGGITKFVKKGDKVLIKPNLLSALPPERAVTTHPEVLKAMIRQIKDAGGIPFVGDSAGGAITNKDPIEIFKNLEKLWEATGIRKVCDKEGAELISFETAGTEVIEIKGRKYTPILYLTKQIFSYDAVISLPKLKTHELVLYTGAIKNFFGCVPGIRKVKYHAQAIHPDDFSEMLVDILSIVKPKLGLIDGIVGMDGEGPSAGRIINPGVIIASADSVALDAVGSKILGFRQGEVSAVKIANSRGLGESNLNSITILGEKLKDVIVKNPVRPSGYRSRLVKLVPKLLVRKIGKFIWTYPYVGRGKCKVCKECVSNCPVGAMAMSDGYPQVSRKKCIMCMCCHELCRYEAVEIRQSWLLNTINFLAKIFSK
jgi:uncharacterized protein (DUF362 family)/NAD-dependent dihydropyrimidine dehydrogenase PreA subunit